MRYVFLAVAIAALIARPSFGKPPTIAHGAWLAGFVGIFAIRIPDFGGFTLLGALTLRPWRLRVISLIVRPSQPAPEPALSKGKRCPSAHT